MDHLVFLMAVLPVVFMVHDFEEIIMLESCLRDHRTELRTRYPRFEQFVARQGLFGCSTSAFAVGVLHEFVWLSTFSLCGVYFGLYGLWFAAFTAYSVHLLIHMGQWLIHRGYIPCIITTVLTLPYCIHTFVVFGQKDLLPPGEMLSWGMGGILVMLATFPMAFFLMRKFAQWERKI
ncbi:Uncharacterised protein [Porphyromonas cangingivalis]|uniref:HXXEE domain-containing protein n=1 Tax=Porphyromonas cangingivalis TaxID=36874 RepID=UPI000D99F53C|nr:HXXEE domain-containing protein [Porphyromonas cangingivalis]SPY35947.1 Uncharacterised protein [Porphyromonas cangingivalis]